MHSNNRRFQIQSVKYNMDDGKLIIKERLGTPYTLIPDEGDYKCQHHRDSLIQNVVISQEIVKGMQLEERDAYAFSGNMPLLYMYERFPISKVGAEVQALDPRHSYLQFHTDIVNLLEAERRQSCDQHFNVRDYNHTNMPVEVRSYNPMNVYFHPYYPNHYLWTSIEFADGPTADTWSGMNTTLRHFLHTVFEAVAVVTGVLLEQVPEDFKTLHRVSIHNGILKLPHAYPKRLYTKKDKERKNKGTEQKSKAKGKKSSETIQEKEKERKKHFDPLIQEEFLYNNIRGRNDRFRGFIPSQHWEKAKEKTKLSMKKPFESLTVKKAREQAAAATAAAAARDTVPQTLANVHKIPVPKFQPSAEKFQQVCGYLQREQKLRNNDIQWSTAKLMGGVHHEEHTQEQRAAR